MPSVPRRYGVVTFARRTQLQIANHRFVAGRASAPMAPAVIRQFSGASSTLSSPVRRSRIAVAGSFPSATLIVAAVQLPPMLASRSGNHVRIATPRRRQYRSHCFRATSPHQHAIGHISPPHFTAQFTPPPLPLIIGSLVSHNNTRSAPLPGNRRLRTRHPAAPQRRFTTTGTGPDRTSSTFATATPGITARRRNARAHYCVT